MKKVALLMVLCFVVAFAGVAFARDQINIVGSSTVYPFATVVAEKFGKATKFKAPKIESTGSGGGLKLFCAGVGVDHPDITNASRRMKKSECEKCNKNGVKEVVEVKIGYDGIVMAQSKKAKTPLNLSLKQVYLALAKQVPDPKDPKKLIDNPYKKWSDIDKSLPDVKIEVLGPPPTSGTRDAFVELAMQGGAKKFDMLAKMKKEDKKKFKKIANTLREDGGFIDAGENDNLIVQKLDANPDAVGIFGFSFLDQNRDKIQGAKIGGNDPTFENISSGAYPLSRPLFFYVKKAHIGQIPGMKEYVSTFMSDKATGEGGYLSDKGLIPAPKEERDKIVKSVKEMEPLSCDKLK